MNLENSKFRDRPERDYRKVNELVLRANGNFEKVGKKSVSILVFISSAAVSVFLYSRFGAGGLYSIWKPKSISDAKWADLTYVNWWANFHRHPALAIVLICLSTYMFYFLIKQLIMGVIFAAFATSITRNDFGVTPNFLYNSDGYYGLRYLREFMQWTYTCTVLDFILTLGVFVVWIPFAQWTVLVILSVMTFNFVTVLYPSSLVVSGTVREKREFVKWIADKSEGGSKYPKPENVDEKIREVWSIPNVPFGVRSTISALTIYSSAPILLALFSALVVR
jgi:hypothetical protein